MSIQTALFARVELANRKEELCKSLQEAFKETGLTLPEIADLCGVSNTTIAVIKTQAARGVTLDKMFLIAVSLGLSVNMKIVCVQQ